MKLASGSLALVPLAMAAFACDPPRPEDYALAQQVEVLRDSRGMVHIYAQNDRDLYYASGYMQAHDRLFSMDLMRRRALGRRAEVLGPDYVDDDRIVRVVGIERWGRESAEAMRREHPDEYELFAAWTAGVNVRIEEVRRGDAPLPYGFGPGELDYLPEPWDVTDPFTVGKLILWGNANQLEFDLLATIIRDFMPATFESLPLMTPLAPAYVLPPEERPESASTSMAIVSAPRPDLPTLPPDAREALRRRLLHVVPSPVGRFSSNNWAVDGQHTANGRPLVAGDPHQPLQSPAIFWMQHLNSMDGGGTIDVAGFSFVGVPSVNLGHNRHVAWTATTNYPDISDLWEVRATTSVAAPGGRDVPIVAHDEVIEVRGEAPRTIRVEEVPGFGVLLPNDITPIPITRVGRRVLYNWVGMQATREAHGFLAFNRAENLEQFEAAVDVMEIACFNFIAATADGISYRSNPLVPDRGPGATQRAHWALLDGDDPATFWTGSFLPTELAPQSRGGERGWIYSANNDPYGFTDDGTTANDPFYYGVFYDPGTRGARIEQRLAELAGRGSLTVDDMEELQLDTHQVVADQLVPVLEEAWTASEGIEELRAFRERPENEVVVRLIAREWNRRADRDQAGAVAFDTFAFFVTKLSLEDDFALVFDAVLDDEPIYMVKWAIRSLRGEYENSEGVLQQGRDRTVLLAIDATTNWLIQRFGGVDPSLYRWADHHGTRFRSPWGDQLDGGWVANDGGLGTINKSEASFFDGGRLVDRLESTSGPIYRMVAGFGDDGIPQARFTFSRGNTGEPSSPWFANLTEDWIEGNYHPLLFTRGAIEADAAERMTLSPAP